MTTDIACGTTDDPWYGWAGADSSVAAVTVVMAVA